MTAQAFELQAVTDEELLGTTGGFGGWAGSRLRVGLGANELGKTADHGWPSAVEGGLGRDIFDAMARRP